MVKNIGTVYVKKMFCYHIFIPQLTTEFSYNVCSIVYRYIWNRAKVLNKTYAASFVPFYAF